MSSDTRLGRRKAYLLERVTIRDLFEKRVTREPSEKALRERALQGILEFVESIGNTHYYDLMLSTVRANAARACKRPGVQWADIASALGKATLTNAAIKDLLNEGRSFKEIESSLAQEISTILNSRPKLG